MVPVRKGPNGRPAASLGTILAIWDLRRPRAQAESEADGELTGVLSLDLRAAATRTTLTATNPTRPAVDTRLELFNQPISTGQGADDGRHCPDNLLCHGGEHLVLSPERVDNIGLGGLKRGFEAATLWACGSPS